MDFQRRPADFRAVFIDATAMAVNSLASFNKEASFVALTLPAFPNLSGSFGVPRATFRTPHSALDYPIAVLMRFIKSA